MIVGLGTDIIETERFEGLNERFLAKVYSEREIKLLGNKKNRLAGNFAAKEAVVKAMGTGFGGISPNEIEILRDNLGKPVCVLGGNALEVAKSAEIDRIIVSISHCRLYAQASAVAERE